MPTNPALICASAILAGLVFHALGGDIYYTGNSDLNLWSYTNRWSANKLPGETATVKLNNDKIMPDHPLTITEGVDAICRHLHIANDQNNNYGNDKRIPTLRITGGSLTVGVPNEDKKWQTYIGEDKNGYGLFLGDGGAVTSAYTWVGDCGIGVLSNRNSQIVVTKEMHLAAHTGSQGEIALLGGDFSVHNDFSVGEFGKGKLLIDSPAKLDCGPHSIRIGGDKTAEGLFVYNGGDINARNLIIGDNAKGTAIISNKLESDLENIYVGNSKGSEGYLKISPTGGFQAPTENFDTTLIVGHQGKGCCDQYGNTKFTWVKIGGTINFWAKYTVYAGATNTIEESIRIGGFPNPNTLSGYGEVNMKGGSLQFPGKGDNLEIGLYGTSFGKLSGWGEIITPSENQTHTLKLGRGIICADGEGELRDLNLNHLTETDNSEFRNQANETNGWYAVNKGRVLYPRAGLGNTSGTVSKMIGDTREYQIPHPVNAVKFEFKNTTRQHNYIRGGLYASDRDDIPAGLPEEKDIVGVWCFDLYDWEDKFSPFDTVRPTFRYDHTRIRPGCHLSLLHYENDQWKPIESTVDESNATIAAKEALPNMNGQDHNIGFYAVVLRKGGTLMILK